MKHFFLGPRAPHASLSFHLLLRMILMFMVRVGFGSVFTVFLAAAGCPHALAASIALVSAVLFVPVWLQKFSLWHCTEMTAGGALFLCGFLPHDPLWYLMPVGAVAYMRPWLEGPEPGGWEPVYKKQEERRRIRKDLKSRRE